MELWRERLHPAAPTSTPKYRMVRTTPTPIQKQIHETETETETMADLDPTLMNIMVVVVVDAGNHTPAT